MSKLTSYYDEFADKYVKAQDEFYLDKENYSRKKLYFYTGDVSGKCVLDIGCGAGDDLSYYYANGADIYGVDPSRKMIDILINRHPEYKNKVKIGDFEDTGFDDAMFDLVSSRYALHYATDYAVAFAELFRVLKPGGIAVIIVAHPLTTYLLKGSKDYFDRAVCHLPLYDNKIVVDEISRTFSDYFTSDILNKFEILAVYEGGYDGEVNRIVDSIAKDGMPDFLLIKYRKRI